MGTKNLAVSSILKCQTGLGKAAESVHFWQTADEEAGERQVQRTNKSHLQDSPGFEWKAVLWFLSGSSSGANVWGKEPSQDNGHRTRVEAEGQGCEKTQEDAKINE